MYVLRVRECVYVCVCVCVCVCACVCNLVIYTCEYLYNIYMVIYN